MEELAAADGKRIECVGYSGLLDYELSVADPGDWIRRSDHLPASA
jgi:hypothetical protein